MCCVGDSLEQVWWSECVVCVGQFGVSIGELMCAVFGRVWCEYGGVSVFCVWDRLEQVWGSECVLCVEQFVVCMGE